MLLRRLLDGGSASALAAAEAGLRAAAVTVVVAPGVPSADTAALVAVLRGRGAAGVEAGAVVGVVGQVTEELAGVLAGHVVGVAGPGAAEEIPSLRRLAAAAAEVAAEQGRLGPTEVADVAVRIALDGRGDLAGAVVERHRPAVDRLGRSLGSTVATTRVWLESAQDADAAAARLFVHPNTVRNRVGSLTEATGLDPRHPFDALTLWWLCREWGPAGARGDGATAARP
jgi:hypothetical protein